MIFWTGTSIVFTLQVIVPLLAHGIDGERRKEKEKGYNFCSRIPSITGSTIIGKANERIKCILVVRVPGTDIRQAKLKLKKICKR
jgi:hypothetical protein